jgi:hypothetical protein
MQYRNIPANHSRSWIDLISRCRDAQNNCRCPVCGQAYSIDYANPSKTGLLGFVCGGMYRVTVDLDGNPVWAGRCGAKMKQQLLAFAEEQ